MAVHPTAIIEPGVSIGRGTVVWSGVHVRHTATIGDDCTVGEKTYISHGVQVGDCVNIGALSYICTGVTIERSVHIGPGTVFNNERFVRTAARERPMRTLVREGASIAAHGTIDCGVTIGRFAMVMPGAVVTGDVPDFVIVAGNPARPCGYACTCGQPLLPAIPTLVDERRNVACPVCDGRYDIAGTLVKRRVTVA